MAVFSTSDRVTRRKQAALRLDDGKDHTAPLPQPRSSDPEEQIHRIIADTKMKEQEVVWRIGRGEDEKVVALRQELQQLLKRLKLLADEGKLRNNHIFSYLSSDIDGKPWLQPSGVSGGYLISEPQSDSHRLKRLALLYRNDEEEQSETNTTRAYHRVSEAETWTPERLLRRLEAPYAVSGAFEVSERENGHLASQMLQDFLNQNSAELGQSKAE